ncbi:Conserved_hypothetical protein [Hexamita inflata]|uniref:Uncharacterized protein n=1 Tax=Hexamita inflata TaxID=28002 RepID=A0AA86PDX3_9EUKA|nr:Conserved hypothetical protein [Hexamita inflata]CAI9940829.1 Conserved hypothetical protein [Hexamita inflata]
MQPINYEIRSKEDLLNHFGSSQKLEISDSEQMENLLEINVPPKVLEDASNRNLLSFGQEFVQQTKELTFTGRKIEHIQLISFLTNLTELNLSNNKISDISTISKLKNLRILDLNSNSIEDIATLQSLPDLTHLGLFYNKFTSYTVALPNLVELSLSCNNLQDKSGLQHSPKLERLDLSWTETTDLRTIPHQLFGLKYLYLLSNNIKEISYLSNIVDLQYLNLGCNKQLQNIGPLKFCTLLIELTISTTNVSDIWPLQFMKNLNIRHGQYESCLFAPVAKLKQTRKNNSIQCMHNRRFSFVQANLIGFLEFQLKQNYQWRNTQTPPKFFKIQFFRSRTSNQR